MSDTPRTEFVLNTDPELHREVVSADFARQLERELSEAKKELARERMRLAACGVVARANTPETAIEARSMSEEYRSASLDDVIRAVDSEMELRAELARAMRVVDAARMYAENDSALVVDAVSEWEAGR